jgi:hypothetical protein
MRGSYIICGNGTMDIENDHLFEFFYESKED